MYALLAEPEGLLRLHPTMPCNHHISRVFELITFVLIHECCGRTAEKHAHDIPAAGAAKP